MLCNLFGTTTQMFQQLFQVFPSLLVITGSMRCGFRFLLSPSSRWSSLKIYFYSMSLTTLTVSLIPFLCRTRFAILTSIAPLCIFFLTLCIQVLSNAHLHLHSQDENANTGNHWSLSLTIMLTPKSKWHPGEILQRSRTRLNTSQYCHLEWMATLMKHACPTSKEIGHHGCKQDRRSTSESICSTQTLLPMKIYRSLLKDAVTDRQINKSRPYQSRFLFGIC